MIDCPAGPNARTLRAPQDTAIGCRKRGEADLLASASMVTANERIRLELSASSWNARAALLQRRDDGMEAKKAKLRSARIKHERL